MIGSGVGAYIMAMAVLSPCPLLVNDSSGDVIIVSELFNFIYSNNSCVQIVKHFLVVSKVLKYITLTSLSSTGVSLAHLHSHSVLCEGDYWGDPA